MKEVTIKYKNKPFEEDLLKRLKGNIFHVTSYDSFLSIKAAGRIRNNSKKEFKVNPGSIGCFSIVKGYVSLFDLQEKTDGIINQTIQKYYFLAPPWFGVNKSFKDSFDIVFLVLDKKYTSLLIPNSAAEEYRISNKIKYIQYIPHTECWFPGDLPVKYLSKAIRVKITKPDHIASMCSGMSESASEELDRLIKQAENNENIAEPGATPDR